MWSCSVGVRDALDARLGVDDENIADESYTSSSSDCRSGRSRVEERDRPTCAGETITLLSPMAARVPVSRPGRARKMLVVASGEPRSCRSPREAHEELFSYHWQVDVHVVVLRFWKLYWISAAGYERAANQFQEARRSRRGPQGPQGRPAIHLRGGIVSPSDNPASTEDVSTEHC